MNNKIVFQGKTKTGKEIIIRYPNETDVLSMQKYINEISKERTYISFQGEQLSFDEENDYLIKQLKKIQDKKSVQLLVFYHDDLIAMSDVNLDQKNHSHIGIFGISLKKEFRGEGVGKILMKKVIGEAKKDIRNLKIICLGCFASNTKACEMYRSFGFKEYGFLPGGVMYQGREGDYIEMYKKM